MTEEKADTKQPFYLPSTRSTSHGPVSGGYYTTSANSAQDYKHQLRKKAGVQQKKESDESPKEMDTDIKVALYIFVVTIILLVLLLIGMATGYPPCYLMKSMDWSCLPLALPMNPLGL